MGLFDFLKKKEFEEIDKLKSEIDLLSKTQIEESIKFNSELERFKSIIDIESEVESQKKNFEQIISSKNSEIKNIENEFNTLNSNYQSALETYKNIRKEVSIFESKLDLIEFGIYEPVYDFGKSDDYREEQNKIIQIQKEMILADTAAICETTWTVQGSEAKGRTVVKVYKKLMLRAFIGECDVLISKVKWNNVNQMKERIQKLFDAINKLGHGFQVSLNSQFLDLKQKELILEYEFQSKRQQEKEEMRAIQEELREEEKAKREIEQAQREAEKEEATYEKALAKTRKEYEESTGEKHDKLKAQIFQLEQELRVAQEKKQRALSMAQQTKRGHVYVISNIGSFGEQVFKIGMTRRLEPIDRIKELGDASVPFQFDIHAMIFSEDAPTLENELHKAFTNKKVNMLNYRKEFFKVTLEEIEQKTKEIGLISEFTRLPEAMEYRETLAILEKLNSKVEYKTIDQIIADEFPSNLN
jgi:predicted  nucleic acid-binding Zn-ribbon protein